MMGEFWFGLRIVVVCTTWYAMSAGQNVVNKLALQSHPYPLTIALSSLLNNVIYAIPLTRLLKIKHVQVTPNYFAKTILPISVGRAVAVGTAYFGLFFNTVSYSQTVKATMPIFTVFLSRFIKKERHSKTVYLSLLPIIVGMLITSASIPSHEFSLVGMLYSLFSTATFAYLNVLAKKVFDDTQMHPITLLYLNSQVSACFLFPIWGLHDGYLIWHEHSGTRVPHQPSMWNFVGILILSGFMGFVQNLCAFILIHQLTTLSYAISNAAKRIAVIVISLIFLQNPVSMTNVLGMMISVSGVFVYNRVRHSESRKRSESPFSYTRVHEGFIRRKELSFGQIRSSDSDVRLILSSG